MGQQYGSVTTERGSSGANVSPVVKNGTDRWTPGRLADYRRQFERTTRMAGEDPSIFATSLDTLAVKAFGDMGQTARLWLIREL